jgi:hypothetical protein
MNESAVYSESDLAPFQRRLNDLRKIVQDDKDSGKHPEAMTKLLERELHQCGWICSILVSKTFRSVYSSRLTSRLINKLLARPVAGACSDP